MIVNRELDSDGNYLTSNYHSGAYDRNLQEDYENNNPYNWDEDNQEWVAI